jgi:xanthine dehydrogenase accessory factor
VAVATIISGPGSIGSRRILWSERASGSLGTERLDDANTDDGRGML